LTRNGKKNYSPRSSTKGKGDLVLGPPEGTGDHGVGLDKLARVPDGPELAEEGAVVAVVEVADDGLDGLGGLVGVVEGDAAVFCLSALYSLIANSL